MTKLGRNIDKEVFEKLYEKHHKKLWSFVLKHVKNPSKAEDLVQDIFLRVWEKRTNIDFQEKFEKLLFVIARNLMINAYHRSILEQEKLNQLLLNKQFEEQASDSSNEKTEEIIAAIKALPQRRKQIFELSLRQGLTYNEISEELSISKKTVEDHITKAKKFLRQKLAHLISLIFLFIQG